MRKWLAVVLLLLLLPVCALADDPLPLKITDENELPVKPSMYGYELKGGKEYLIEGSSNGGIMLDVTGNVTVVLKDVNLKDSLEISSRALGDKQVTLQLTGNNYISSYNQPAILVMADRCDLTIQMAPSNPPHSLKVKSDKRAGIQNSNGKVNLESGYIDIQGGSDEPYAIIGKSIKWKQYTAYPKTRADYGKTWTEYTTSTPMGKLFTTRQVGAYALTINAGRTSERLMRPDGTYNISAVELDGYDFVNWESPQKTQINDVDGQTFNWNSSSINLKMPECDVELNAVWKKKATQEGTEGETQNAKQYANLTIKVTPTGAGIVKADSVDITNITTKTYEIEKNNAKTIELTATPINSDYEFVNWSAEGDVVVSENSSYTIDLEGDRTLYANFRKKEHVDTIVITKKVEGDLDPSVPAEPIDYVYVWGDSTSVWGCEKITGTGYPYTAVDVYKAGGTKPLEVKVSVSGEATWYVVGEVLASGKVTGYTCQAKAMPVQDVPDADSLPVPLGDGVEWAMSAIRTNQSVSGSPEINMLPYEYPVFTFVNTYTPIEIDLPQTGDKRDLMFWLSLAMTSMTMLALISHKKREV